MLDDYKKDAEPSEEKEKIAEIIDVDKLAEEINKKQKEKEELELKRKNIIKERILIEREMDKEKKLKLENGKKIYEDNGYKVIDSTKFWAIIIIATIILGTAVGWFGWSAANGKFQDSLNISNSQSQQSILNNSNTNQNQQLVNVTVYNNIILYNSTQIVWRNMTYNNTNGTG